MKKFLAVALSVATLAMSTAAFAAGVNDDKNVASLDATDKATFEGAKGQMSVVVVPANFAGSADDIYYINQDEATGMATIVNSMGLKAELADGDYEVRVGGTDATVFADGFKSFPFTVSSGGSVMYGDVDGSKVIDGGDAISLAQYLAEMEVTIDLAASDVYYDGEVNGSDAITLAQYLAEMEVTLGPTE